MSDITIEREQNVRELAYELWNHAGRPHGRQEEFWSQAEAEYEQRREHKEAGELETAGQHSFPASDPVNHM